MCPKNGDWNETVVLGVTLRNWLQVTGWLERFSQHGHVLTHCLTVTSLPFLRWTHIEAWSDSPQKLCADVTNAEDGCDTRFALSGWHGNALTWLGMVGDHRLRLQEPRWLQYGSGHVPDLAVLPGCPFPPTANCTLPGAPRLRTTPFMVIGHPQKLPHGLLCSPGPAKHWWADGFQITCQITVYTLLKQNAYFNLQS